MVYATICGSQFARAKQAARNASMHLQHMAEDLLRGSTDPGCEQD